MRDRSLRSLIIDEGGTEENWGASKIIARNKGGIKTFLCIEGGGGGLRNLFFIFINVYGREKHHIPKWFCMNSCHKNKILMDH